MDQENREDLHVTVARIDATLTMLSRHLLGNGQPGAIQKLEDRQADLIARTDSLENSRAWVKGAIALAIALFTALGSTLVAHVLGATGR